MAKKEFTYRGKNLEELKLLGEKEFAELLPSREKRSLLRGVNRGINKKIDEIEKNKTPDRLIKTHRRDCVITPRMIGLNFGIHSGNEFKSVEIQEEMIGHKFGEFALTRKRLRHGSAGIGATRSSTAITVR